MQYISRAVDQDSLFIWFQQDECENESAIPPLMNSKYCFVQVCGKIISLSYLLSRYLIFLSSGSELDCSRGINSILKLALYVYLFSTKALIYKKSLDLLLRCLGCSPCLCSVHQYQLNVWVKQMYWFLWSSIPFLACCLLIVPCWS